MGVSDRYVGWKKQQLRWFNSPDGRQYGGACQTSVENLEKRYSISIPLDFKEYLLKAVPGSGTDLMDNDYFDWWPIDRIKNIPDEYEHEINNPEIAESAPKYLFFADYLIWCWAWAICCDVGPNYGKVVVIDGNDRFVADSFDAFVDMALTDVDALS
ncbi:hypothetical protein A8B75_03890 [Sphingomonadales bacterium EhC05]|nr:hypothetical protein A8B75_03890 [Sphingomonadales bacterium EhC05]